MAWKDKEILRIQTMNHASLWSCLSASTPASVLRGKVSDTMLLTSMHEPKLSVSPAASWEWEEKEMGRRERRVPVSRVCSVWFRHFRDSGINWGQIQNLCKVPKVMWDKTRQNLSSTCGRSSVLFLYWKKGELKCELISAHTWLNSTVHGGSAAVGVASWSTEVMTWLG